MSLVIFLQEGEVTRRYTRVISTRNTVQELAQARDTAQKGTQTPTSYQQQSKYFRYEPLGQHLHFFYNNFDFSSKIFRHQKYFVTKYFVTKNICHQEFLSPKIFVSKRFCHQGFLSPKIRHHVYGHHVTVTKCPRTFTYSFPQLAHTNSGTLQASKALNISLIHCNAATQSKLSKVTYVTPFSNHNLQ